MIEASDKDIDAPYWAALAEGRLALPRCPSCGRWHWPAVARCGACGTWGPTWQDLPMAGSIFTWTRTWHPFAGTEGLTAPFVTVVVEIAGADGRRLMGLLAGHPADEPVPIGAQVTGTVTHTAYGGDSVPTITWRLTA